MMNKSGARSSRLFFFHDGKRTQSATYKKVHFCLVYDKTGQQDTIIGRLWGGIELG